MCITSQGKSIKLKVSSIRVMGRSAQGVRIFSIDKPDFVIGVDRIVQEESVYRKQGAGAESEAEAGAEALEEDSGEFIRAEDAAEDQDGLPEPETELDGSPFDAEPEEDRDNETQGELFDEEE
jgi:DNA gyrase/topoisomerase IV subunit A